MSAFLWVLAAAVWLFAAAVFVAAHRVSTPPTPKGASSHARERRARVPRIRARKGGA